MVELSSTLSTEELMSKLSITTDPVPMPSAEGSPYIQIRHALSEYNVREKIFRVMPEVGDEFKIDRELFDPSLHRIGVAQCEAYHSQINKVNFIKVFVSPMRRAMLTAIHMFKNHPNLG